MVSAGNRQDSYAWVKRCGFVFDKSEQGVGLL